MSKDVRPIDANALLKKIAHHTVHDSLNRVTFEAAHTYEQVKGDMFSLAQKAPTIDAVPVVRCKDCKNRGTPYSCPMRKLVMPVEGPGSYEDCTEDEGFCHLGAKMDGGAADGSDS